MCTLVDTHGASIEVITLEDIVANRVEMEERLRQAQRRLVGAVGLYSPWMC